MAMHLLPALSLLLSAQAANPSGQTEVCTAGECAASSLALVQRSHSSGAKNTASAHGTVKTHALFQGRQVRSTQRVLGDDLPVREDYIFDVNDLTHWVLTFKDGVPRTQLDDFCNSVGTHHGVKCVWEGKNDQGGLDMAVVEGGTSVIASILQSHPEVDDEVESSSPEHANVPWILQRRDTDLPSLDMPRSLVPHLSKKYQTVFMPQPWRFAQDLEADFSASHSKVCYVTQFGVDGFGHQLFGMLSVMGAHGVLSPESGKCYVYGARSRKLTFQHIKHDLNASHEATSFMNDFLSDFSSKVGPRGCATAELVAVSPEKILVQKGRWDIHCSAGSTTQLDSLWYGVGDGARDGFEHKQIMKTTPFMQAVMQNATQIAALAAAHLPQAPIKAALAVHMRFGDRSDALTPTAFGQEALLLTSNISQLSPVHVFSDDIAKAAKFLSHTALAGAKFHEPADVTVVQALAIMVAADVFVGSRSDVSSSAALMRVGLGKTQHATFMPRPWQWAKGFEAALSHYTEFNQSVLS